MAGQVEEFIDEQPYFVVRMCPCTRLGLPIQAAQAVDNQHGLRCDGPDEFDLLWHVAMVNTSLGDAKRANQLLLEKQGNQQQLLGATIDPVARHLAQAIRGQYHLLTRGEAGKCRFVDKIRWQEAPSPFSAILFLLRGETI